VTIYGNKEMLRILVQNLLDNAMYYSPEKAIITVQLTDHSPDYHNWCLQIHNSGVTLSHLEIEHIFEPFYRKSHQGQQGTGLGLAIVSWIAKQHHLRISCQSNEEGITMTLVPIP
jgi:signal transduction histidine kinase